MLGVAKFDGIVFPTMNFTPIAPTKDMHEINVHAQYNSTGNSFNQMERQKHTSTEIQVLHATDASLHLVLCLLGGSKHMVSIVK